MSNSNKSLLNFNKELGNMMKNNRPPPYTPPATKISTNKNNRIGETIKKTYNNATNKAKETIKKYPMQAAIAVVVIFSVIAIYYAYVLMKDYNTTVSGEPWIVEGNKSAERQWTVPGKLIKPSVDRPHGIEFTYAFWMYINNWGVKDKEWKHVFHKGNSTGVPLQSPGVWLYPNVNKMAINIDILFFIMLPAPFYIYFLI